MEYRNLGTCGLKVSRIALGCMSFGDTSRGFNEWALDDAGAEPIFREAVDLGVTFTDEENRVLEESYTPRQPTGY
jgi:1-deoxyxylulose-5-phosphate synthase